MVKHSVPDDRFWQKIMAVSGLLANFIANKHLIVSTFSSFCYNFALLLPRKQPGRSFRQGFSGKLVHPREAPAGYNEK